MSRTLTIPLVRVESAEQFFRRWLAGPTGQRVMHRVETERRLASTARPPRLVHVVELDDGRIVTWSAYRNGSASRGFAPGDRVRRAGSAGYVRASRRGVGTYRGTRPANDEQEGRDERAASVLCSNTGRADVDDARDPEQLATAAAAK